MVEAHRTRFVPDHAVIAFAGDITLADARKLVETKLGGLEEVRRGEAGGYEPAGSTRRQGLPRHASIVGADEPDRRRAVDGRGRIPDYDALTVANRVLGGAMGRLFRHLREEKGYTYGVGSGFSATRHPRRVVRPRRSVQNRGHRSGADRSARRDRLDARHAGARRRS